MIFALVPVPPSQRSARFLSLPHSGWPTILELTCWVRATNPSNLEQKRARSHQIGDTKYTETELGFLVDRRASLGSSLALSQLVRSCQFGETGLVFAGKLMDLKYESKITA
jgi:hypothetical protein